MAKKYGFVIDNKELMKEWDWAKNKEEGLDPHVLTCGSPLRAHWKCSICGNEWQTKISHRNKGTGCKKCLHRKLATPEKGKSLLDIRPDLAEQWSPNNYLKPNEVYPNSNFPYFWICPKCHSEWSDTVAHRVRDGRGCIYCSNKVVKAGQNDLATVHPEMLKYWDFDRNKEIGLDPTKLTSGSKKKAYWLCERGHSTRAAIYSKVLDGNKCDLCNKELRVSFPEKVIAFYVSKLFTDAIENYRGKELKRKELDIYIPSLKVAIEYDGYRWHKDTSEDLIKDLLCEELGITVFRIRENGCPDYKSSSLKYYVEEKKYDELSKAIIKIIERINEKLGLSLLVSINVERDSPEILANVISKEKENSVANSDFADKWDAEKNKEINPSFIPIYSNRKFWWKCPKCGYSWERTPGHMVRGNGCQNCSGRLPKRKNK